MNKHTPGPWTFDAEKVSGPHLTQTYLFAHGDVIGRIYADSTRDNSQANARLIAAAPLMAEALLVARAWLRDNCPPEDESALAAVSAALKAAGIE